jgi:hypothetical protein
MTTAEEATSSSIEDEHLLDYRQEFEFQGLLRLASRDAPQADMHQLTRASRLFLPPLATNASMSQHLAKGGSERARRASLSTDGLRTLRAEVMTERLASISSLSVTQVSEGGAAVVLRLPGCTINTSHVTLKQMIMFGWTAEGNGTADPSAFLPPSVFKDETVIGEKPTSFEMIHIYWDQELEEKLQLPSSFAPLLSLQVRRKGEEKAIQFGRGSPAAPIIEPLKAAWIAKFKMRKSVAPAVNLLLGTRYVAYGAWFDYSWRNWWWTTEAVKLKTPPQENDDVIVTQQYSLQYSLYSVYKVEEGCDGVAQSRIYFDNCLVSRTF